MASEYTTLMRPWFERFVAVPDETRDVQQPPVSTPAAAPVDVVGEVHSQSVAQLRGDIIGRILAQPPAFFEHVIVDLLFAMGYGGRRRDLAQHLGRSGDGGIDGVIEQDQLGLDRIYLQAKRYRPGIAVPVSDVRDFIGALETRHARKGVLVTTSLFTKAARQVAESVRHQVVLIDNIKLADLMIRHNVGVVVHRSFQFKAVDASYFKQSRIQAAAGTFDLNRLLRATSRK